MSHRPVLITDVRYRMSLSLIRSLGKKGIKVIAAESSSTAREAALGFYSRYISASMTIADASKDEKAFIDDLVAYSHSLNEKPVLIPVGIHSIMAASRNKDQLQPYYDFLVPTKACVDTANDTGKLLEVAKSAGVPMPATTSLMPGETIDELSMRLSFPVVIKYRQGELLRLGPEKRYKIVDDRSGFITAFEYMHKIQEYPLVQEYIKGEGYGVSAVFDNNSNPIAVFCHRRLREYPVSGGPSCFCESFWDKAMVEYSINLLKALKWQGVAMVEFKGEPNGRFALMEINPRIWGSFPLTIAAGADFPYTIYNASIGQAVAFDESNLCPNYKVGKKMRYILQDLLSFKGYIKTRRDKMNFLLGYIKDLLNPTVSDGVFDIRDMKSSFQYFKQAFKKYNN